MANILVTGGPVHAKLDAIKIVTNRFRGGRIAALASQLARMGHKVTYVCARHSVQPVTSEGLSLTTIHHDGFAEYMDHVVNLAPRNAMTVLGAAVANLVPEPPWGTEQKFPSHYYREGDVVKVPFRVAPRVINMVKEAAPRTTLVGFKLLSGSGMAELVKAAETVMAGSKADLVVANDATDLDSKLLLTKERGVLPLHDTDLVGFLDDLALDRYYASRVLDSYALPHGANLAVVVRGFKAAQNIYSLLAQSVGSELAKHSRHGARLFGCLAVRCNEGGFVCSARGKRDLGDFVHVEKVDHSLQRVHTIQGKASLNAPLLATMFSHRPDALAVVHTHETGTDLPVLPYAPSGTVRDSRRDLPEGDFEIEGHGAFRYVTEQPS